MVDFEDGSGNNYDVRHLQFTKKLSVFFVFEFFCLYSQNLNFIDDSHM